MDNFEVFLRELLKSVYKEYPYDKQQARISFEKIITTHEMNRMEKV